MVVSRAELEERRRALRRELYGGSNEPAESAAEQDSAPLVDTESDNVQTPPQIELEVPQNENVEVATRQRRIPIAPDEEPEVDVDVEMSMGGTSMSAVSDKEPVYDVPPRRGRVSKGDKPAYIRDFPRSLLEVCQRMFPNVSATDAVSAYVLMKSGIVADDIPDSVYELVRTCPEAEGSVPLDTRVRRVEQKLDAIAAQDREILLAAAYAVVNLEGFTQGGSNTARDIDLLQPSIESFLTRLKEQTKLKHTRDAAAEGRPKRQDKQ